MPLVVMVAAIVGSMIVAALLEVTGMGTDSQNAIIGIVFSGALVAGGLALREGVPMPFRADITAPRVPLGKAVAIGLGMGLAFRFLSGIITAIGESIDPSLCEKAKEATDIIPPETWHKVLLAISLVALAPFGEELLFRGFMFRGFGSVLPLVPAAIVAGVVFGLAHPQYYETWSLLLSICIMGVGLCLIYRRWGFTAAVATHLVFNLIPAILIFVLSDASDTTCTSEALASLAGLSLG